MCWILYIGCLPQPCHRLVASSSLADIDADGDLDAFIGNYDGNTVVCLTQQMIDGLGADIFIFHSGSGRDTIKDFNHSQSDKISLQSDLNGSGITDAASALAHVSDKWGSAVLDLGGGNVIKFVGLMTADLTVADFTVF